MTFLPTAHALRQNERNTSQGPGNYVPAYAIQERAISENPDAGPQGAGWKEEEAYTLEARHHVQMVAAPLTKGSATGEGVNAPGRRQEDDVNVIAFNASGGGEKDLMPRENLANPVTGSNGDPGAIAYALNAKAGNRDDGESETFIPATAGVRRLTPTECERLQGLPDGWTQLGDTPDSRRYSALGDAVTANVAEWIGGRLVTELVA